VKRSATPAGQAAMLGYSGAELARVDRRRSELTEKALPCRRQNLVRRIASMHGRSKPSSSNVAARQHPLRVAQPIRRLGRVTSRPTYPQVRAAALLVPISDGPGRDHAARGTQRA
jgi:hypothetical protein